LPVILVVDCSDDQLVSPPVSGIVSILLTRFATHSVFRWVLHQRTDWRPRQDCHSKSVRCCTASRVRQSRD